MDTREDRWSMGSSNMVTSSDATLLESYVSAIPQCESFPIKIVW